MQIGMIGLGKMGGNMTRRLMKAGHRCVVFARAPTPSRRSSDGKVDGSAARGSGEALGKNRAPYG